jgi:hypothetical protein
LLLLLKDGGKVPSECAAPAQELWVGTDSMLSILPAASAERTAKPGLRKALQPPGFMKSKAQFEDFHENEDNVPQTMSLFGTDERPVSLESYSIRAGAWLTRLMMSKTRFDILFLRSIQATTVF